MTPGKVQQIKFRVQKEIEQVDAYLGQQAIGIGGAGTCPENERTARLEEVLDQVVISLRGVFQYAEQRNHGQRGLWMWSKPAGMSGIMAFPCRRQASVLSDRG